MTQSQWVDLLDVIAGKELESIPAGFIIDSPWLPNWYGCSILDYFSSDDLWFRANLHAITSFPDIMFLPGFWSEYGMCSEPSAFGARCSFPANEFPHAHKCIHSIEDIRKMALPDPARDGFAPFILNRLITNRKKIEENGHQIYFSVSRGPLNVASYLMGTTEFLTAMITNPVEIHRLLRIITDYLVGLHNTQQSSISSIDGMLVLDDIIGFIGEDEFKEFGLPYFSELFNKDVSVRFLHNDASLESSLSYLNEMRVNLFNMGFDSNLNELKHKTDNQITMLGNIPPRDVLARGSAMQIEKEVTKMIQSLEDRKRIIASCGGGMPPDVSSENISSFSKAVERFGT